MVLFLKTPLSLFGNVSKFGEGGNVKPSDAGGLWMDIQLGKGESLVLFSSLVPHHSSGSQMGSLASVFIEGLTSKSDKFMFFFFSEPQGNNLFFLPVDFTTISVLIWCLFHSCGRVYHHHRRHRQMYTHFFSLSVTVAFFVLFFPPSLEGGRGDLPFP